MCVASVLVIVPRAAVNDEFSGSIAAIAVVAAGGSRVQPILLPPTSKVLEKVRVKSVIRSWRAFSVYWALHYCLLTLT